MFPADQLHWVLLGIFVLVYLVILIHESGHALMALFYGRKIQRFQIGTGWVSYSVTIRGTEFRLGFPPFNGKTIHGRPPKDLPAKRHFEEQIKIVAAGPLFCAMVLLVTWVFLTLTTQLPPIVNLLIITSVLDQLLDLLPPFPDGKKLKMLIANYRSLPRDP